jgi:hypothetical protein
VRRILAIALAATLVLGQPGAAALAGSSHTGSGWNASDGPAPVAVTPALAALVAPAARFSGIDRIVVIVMENHAYGSIVDNSAAPYLNGLISRYGLATAYTAVAHPSEPNYVALFTGSTQGITDDAVHSYTRPSLADQLEAHGRTWRVVAENVPGGCFTGAVAYGGADGAGWYARKHEPAIMSTRIAGDPVRCARITNMGHFTLGGAAFQLIIPNMCHDMHDCSVAAGDAFLKRLVVPITKSPLFAHTLLVITFDEGTTDAGGGGRVATVVVGPMVRRGFQSAIPHNHYSLLRTIEDAWGLGCLAKSCAAGDLGEFIGP